MNNICCMIFYALHKYCINMILKDNKQWTKLYNGSTDSNIERKTVAYKQVIINCTNYINICHINNME